MGRGGGGPGEVEGSLGGVGRSWGEAYTSGAGVTGESTGACLKTLSLSRHSVGLGRAAAGCRSPGRLLPAVLGRGLR